MRFFGLCLLRFFLLRLFLLRLALFRFGLLMRGLFGRGLRLARHLLRLGRDFGCLEVDGGRSALGTAGLGSQSCVFRLVVGHRDGSSHLHALNGPDCVGFGPTSYAKRVRKARSKESIKAFSSGVAATRTCEAPASRSTPATVSDRQHCGMARAEISTPSARAASRKARALRREKCSTASIPWAAKPSQTSRGNSLTGAMR